MAVLAFGVHHRSTPLDLLEDLSLSVEEQPKVLGRLTDSVDVREAVVLSTCHRVEVYADVVRFHDAVQHVRDVVCEAARRSAADVSPYIETWFDDAAAAHLFAVAGGLDSLVVGESEILAQVKQAAQMAEAEGTLGRSLRPLFRHALEAAKRVRTETGIARSTASVASAAVALVRESAPFAGQPVGIVGAGQAAASAARALRSAGASELVVVNRDEAAGLSLAAVHGARRVSFEHLGEVLGDVAVLICSTAATRPILTPGLVATAMSRRGGRPLTLVDIALPRDVHPDVAAVPGVRVVNLDDIRARAAAGLEQRYGEVARGEEIVNDEVERWRLARLMRSGDPVVRALRDQAEAVAVAELARRRGRLARLGDADRAEVEALIRAVVRKLLHHPTAALRAHAADPDYAALVDAAAVLFDLDLE
jgi:glutamyl-tRNA reductase